MTKGLVIVLPGIEGRSMFNAAIRQGLSDGGVDWGIEVHDWTTGVPLVLYHLFAKRRNKKMALDVVRRIGEYRLTHPDRPVVLVGQSGGAAIATWVAEAMPADQKLTGVILIAPALSPNYLLEQALCGTERGIVSFHSRKDWVFLGVGTVMYGTMDRKHVSSAGRVGFEIPDEIWRPPEYEKLFQIAWRENMSKAGNAGGHLTSSSARFVSTFVAPLVLAKTWDRKLVTDVRTREPAPRSRPTSVPTTTKPVTPPASKVSLPVKAKTKIKKTIKEPSPPVKRVRGPLPPASGTPKKPVPAERPTTRPRTRVRGPLPPRSGEWKPTSALPPPDQWQVEPPIENDGHRRPRKPDIYFAVGA